MADICWRSSRNERPADRLITGGIQPVRREHLYLYSSHSHYLPGWRHQDMATDLLRCTIVHHTSAPQNRVLRCQLARWVVRSFSDPASAEAASQSGWE